MPYGLHHAVHLMNTYPGASKEPFRGHPLHETVRALCLSLATFCAVRQASSLAVKASIGKGNWASIPWVAFLDSRATSTSRRGVYIIFLFRADMTGAYLTFNQGITDLTERLGRATARAMLAARAEQARALFPELTRLGFATTSRIDLRTRSAIASGYECSTIAHRFFTKNDIEAGDDVLRSLGHLFDIYERYVQTQTT